jgi:hypothetical protein
VRYALLAFLSVLFAGIPARAENQVVLKAFQGYDFTKHAVTKSGDQNADVSFAVDKATVGAISARKIKNLGSGLPDATAFLGVQQWPAVITTPTPGYYAVQGHDGRSIYLVQLLSFDNPGHVAAHWQMSLTWERLQ